jgi:REP element-mobilizing transposase RayT
MSYTSILVHYVFATHERRPLVSDELQPKLWAYMGGITRTNGMKALAIGGMRNHVHLLLSLPATITIAKAVQLIKAGSSKMVERSEKNKMVRMAGRIWGVYHRSIPERSHHSLYSQSGAASCQEEFW